jgi:hypothetical protein
VNMAVDGVGVDGVGCYVSITGMNLVMFEVV